jgi:hypothetical protein
MSAARLLHTSCLLLAFLVTGCSQNGLLTKPDYQKSQRHFLDGDLQGAREDHPRGAEEGGFITSMEQGYLSLLQGKPELKDLKRQADAIENRVRYHVSREARTFFYVQTPEDYYASEHEVIWLHFLLSWGYSMQGNYTAGCVEAREAGSLLTLPWSPEGHFDDATMRLMLASLWAMCGDWREAQVDLRAAWFLDNSLTWAKQLADRDKPPADLFIVLGGPGPQVEWKPELSTNLLRSERQVSFVMRGAKSNLSIVDQGGRIIEPHRSPDASKWYERHLARESELHELIADSAYGGKAAVSGVVAGAKIAATTSAGLLIGIGGTALGAAIMYYGSNSADAIELGVLVIGFSIGMGIQIAEEGYHESTHTFKKEVDPSTTYRYVRYLPEYLWMGWSEQHASYPVEVRTFENQSIIRQPTALSKQGMAVSIAFVSDATTSSCIYTKDTGRHIELLRDAEGRCSSTPSW